MKQTDGALILAVIELVLKYGVPATIQIIRAFDVDDPTLEDIQALARRVPEPEKYF